MEKSDWTPERVVAATIWGEARGEGRIGRLAVAHVIANRVKRLAKDRSVQEKDWVDVCLKPKQFSCWDDHNRLKMEEPWKWDGWDLWRECQLLGFFCVLGRIFYTDDPTKGSTHYHEVSIKPSWAEKLEYVTTIGRHMFYKEV